MPKLVGILAIIILLPAAPVFAVTEPQFSLGLGVDYAKGNFETDYTSTYTTIPLIFDWFPNERLNFELTVPYVKQSSSNSSHVTTSNSSSFVGGMGMSGGRGGVVLPCGEDQSGLGDITLTGAYNIVLDGEDTPNIGVSGYLKFPTANQDKGLGTGAFDWGPGLLVSKRLGAWQPFSEGRYVLQGNSRVENGARNYFLADIGIGYDWHENLSNSLFCRLGTPAFDGLAAPMEMRLKTVWGFWENTSVEFYFLKGLSHGSPDFGGGMSFFVSF